MEVDVVTGPADDAPPATTPKTRVRPTPQNQKSKAAPVPTFTPDVPMTGDAEELDGEAGSGREEDDSREDEDEDEDENEEAEMTEKAVRSLLGSGGTSKLFL